MTDRSPAELAQILETLEAALARKRFRAFDFFKPYPKQRAFFAMGAHRRERLFMAGNQVGKTHAGAFETACHLTGEYPPWWEGKRFTHPTVGWIAGVTSADVRNISQRKLCGPPGVDPEFGTGMIPKEAFAERPSLGRGITDGYDQIQVFHKTNGKPDGISRALFKSYEQGRKTFQGDTIDFGWGDEESEKQDVYDEFLTRLTGDGVLYTTFTPMFGPTELVNSFTNADHPDRAIVTMTLDEAEHFSAEEKVRRFAGYKQHERDARAMGVPKLGSGAIFTFPEEGVIEPPLSYLPPHWVKIWGIDPGIGHPFGAALLIWDQDNDIIHVHHAFRMVGEGTAVTPINHAAAMRPLGAAVPVAWPKDAGDREKGSGEPLADQYRKHGLRMLHEHATWPDGSVSTEAGILEWQEREKTGRLKIAMQLGELLEERRFYHRKDGQIVKVRDDIISAVRVALMMKRHARAVGLGGQFSASREPQLATGVDFDVFA